MNFRSLRAALLFVTALGLARPCPASAADLQPVDLRCEYRRDPLGVDATAPRLGWQLEAKSSRARGLRQSAYQVLVATDPKLLRPGQADLWDSGAVASAESSFVAYGGSALRSGQTCHWSVRVADAGGDWSGWSSAARWTVGLLEHSDWQAEWIGTGESFQRGKGSPPPDTAPADPWLRRTFVLESRPRQALAYVASVGYHELWINGRKVGDAWLQPSVTDHSKRARYDTYDIAPYLQPGTNAVGLWLGTGWSIFPKFETPDKPRAPIVRAQLDLTLPDASRVRVGTDATWRTHASPSRLLGVWDFTQFGGELYDAGADQPEWATPGFDDRAWTPVRVFHPKLVVSADPVEPNRRQESIQAVAVTEPRAGVYRVDLGRNFSGMMEFDVRGQPGDRVEFQFSEQEGQAMTHRLRSVYVVGPQGTGTFRNRFNYFTGRWVTVTGLRRKPGLEDIRAWEVRTDFAAASAFECSLPLFNRIHATTLSTFESLALGGYLVDCAHRERMGYGGDAHATTTTGLMNYRLGALYTKWAEDWRDAQGRSSAWGVGAEAATSGLEPGNLPYTAPTYWGGGGPGWCGYVVHLPAELWTAYGDRRVLESMFPTIERWLAFLETKQRDDVLRRWGGQWDFLGDWLWPGADGVNGDTRETLFFNNCYWIYNLQTAARIAQLLGRSAEAETWNRRAETVRRAVHREFYDPSRRTYVNGSQAYLALALVAQVPPADLRPAVWQALEKEILETRRGHIHAGITGGAFVFKALAEAGRDDLLATMAAQPDYPGWGDMLNRGATSFWESWENNPGLSYLHSSYLYVGAWFIRGVLGIQPLPSPDANTAGFARFRIHPAPLDRPDLTWAKGHFDSLHGRIASSWRQSPKSFELEVTIPPNTVAEVDIPGTEPARITEQGRSLDRARGVKVLGPADGRVRLEVGSGKYRFVRTQPSP